MQCAYASTSQALIAAAEAPQRLPLTASLRFGIGRVWPRSRTDGFFCTGSRVASEWVLTASHCWTDGAIEVEFANAHGRTPKIVPVIEAVRHPSLDLMLLRLDDDTEEAQNEVLGVALGELNDAWTGSYVQLAGYGDTGDGPSATLQFIAEPVVELTETAVIVDGQGYSGACRGDSGGPLIVPIEGGVGVAGVLSTGAASCVGEDLYVRLSAARDWLDATLGRASTSSATCASFATEGRCEHGFALRCAEDGRLLSESCSDAAPCGWDANAAGFRCTQKDTCSGVDSSGECDGSVLRTCVLGRVDQIDCAECGRGCVLRPPDGKARCEVLDGQHE